MAENNLGTASVDITASLEPLHKGLAQARTDLQSSLDGMTGDVGKFDTDAGKLLQGLTDKFRNLISIFGVGFGIREVVSTIEDSQNAIARLGSVLQSTGGAAGYSQKELIQMASALQRTSNFSDTTIEAAEGVILSFTHLGHDVFPQALQASVNLASAMKIDLPSAAREVARALDDPTKGMMLLSRAGVGLSESQAALVKHLQSVGDLSGADAIILDVLGTKFGGAAAAAHDTLGGALTGLGHSMEDLAVELGNGGLGGALKQDAKDMAGGADAAHGLAEAIGAVAGAIVSFPRTAMRDLSMSFGGDANAARMKGEDAAKNLNDILNAAGPGHAMPLHPDSSGSAATSKAAEDAAKAQQHLQEEFAKTNLSINLQTADYARLTDAIGKGTAAMRSAQIANDVANEQSKLGPGATPAMLSQIAQEITARDQAKFALDDHKAALEADSRAQEKNNELIQQAIGAADADTGKLKLVGDQYEALTMAIQDGDLPAMLQMNTALTGMGKELDSTAKSAQKTSMMLEDELAKGAESIANTLVDTSSSLITLDRSMNTSGESSHKFGKHFQQTTTAMQAFSKAGLDIAKTIEKMIVELTIVNPMLNALQGAITGTSGNKPSIWGGGKSSTPGGPPQSSGSTIGGMLSSAGGMLKGGFGDVVSFIKNLIESPNGSPDPTSFANFTSSIAGMLDSNASSDAIAGAVSSGSFATSGASGMGGLLTDFSGLFGFASGGSFDVGGRGAVDSQLVAFKATPGEHVQIGQNAPAAGASTTNVHVMNNSGAPATVTHKKNSQGGSDVMVQIGAAMASDVANGGQLSRSISQNLGANRVPISR